MGTTGEKFFAEKKDWSRRKDQILIEYLPSYIPKLAHSVGDPICIVDGFAGPGRFGDGEPGSPLIIADVVEKALSSGDLPVRVSAFVVERDPNLHKQLVECMAQFSFAKTRCGEFLSVLEEIEALGKAGTLFLYLDPWTVQGLEWAALDRIFRLLGERKSIEVLLNFNAASFARRGLAALKMDVPAPKPGEEDTQEADPVDPSTLPTIEHLNDIVGGDWWREILADASLSFARKVDAIRDGFCKKLRGRFREVCVHDVKAHWKHQVPKYSLLFGTRNAVALMLMNDAMAKSREMYEEETRPAGGQLTFFEERPESVVPDDGRLRNSLLEYSASWIARKDLTRHVARAHMGMWTESRMNAEVRTLLRGRPALLQSETGKPVINSEVRVRRSTPDAG